MVLNHINSSPKPPKIPYLKLFNFQDVSCTANRWLLAELWGVEDVNPQQSNSSANFDRSSGVDFVSEPGSLRSAFSPWHLQIDA